MEEHLVGGDTMEKDEAIAAVEQILATFRVRAHETFDLPLASLAGTGARLETLYFDGPAELDWPAFALRRARSSAHHPARAMKTRRVRCTFDATHAARPGMYLLDRASALDVVEHRHGTHHGHASLPQRGRTPSSSTSETGCWSRALSSIDRGMGEHVLGSSRLSTHQRSLSPPVCSHSLLGRGHRGPRSILGHDRVALPEVW